MGERSLSFSLSLSLSLSLCLRPWPVHYMSHDVVDVLELTDKLARVGRPDIDVTVGLFYGTEQAKRRHHDDGECDDAAEDENHV